ncbi:cysteine synthase family protein [Peribacillus simplex]|uniref:cysteine synthase family protein n=1 Tax=Peribacillus simplex TaxID=1478 RepID=UPI003D26B47B
MIPNIIDSIGNTPLVRLNKSSPTDGNLFAKLELLNHFGMKDRVAKNIILQAKKSGELKESATIIESSSGTMALGVALIGTALGHEVIIVTDPRIDPLTLAKLKALGANVHIVKNMDEKGWQGARLKYLYALLEKHTDYFWPKQYENPDNPNSYKSLANELVKELNKIDILVGSVGSGGSLCGIAKALRIDNPNLKVIAVDSVGSIIFDQPLNSHRLQGGLGNSIVPLNVQHDKIDEVHWLNDDEAFESTLNLAKNEKIFAGNSSGSVYTVASWVSKQVSDDCNIVAVFPDRGDRYYETIYNEKFREEHNVKLGRLSDGPKEILKNEVASNWSYCKLKGDSNGKSDKKTPLVYRV